MLSFLDIELLIKKKKKKSAPVYLHKEGILS